VAIQSEALDEETFAVRFRWLLQTAALLISALVELSGPPQARADWYFPLVRITCVPDAKYSAVETLGLYNVDTAPLATEGIFDLSVLAEKPVKCELPQGTLSIEVLNYHAPQAQGMCGAVQDAALRVSLAGAEVAFAGSTHGGCFGSWRHDIRISEYEVHHCILEFKGPTQVVETKDFTKVEARCKNLPLP
jgi:hypothetical protein